MNPNLIIRKASIDDLPDVIKLYSQDVTTKDNLISLHESIRIFNKFNKYPNYSLFIAIDEFTIGTFSLLIMDHLAHNGKPSGIMEDIFVDIDHRSQGVGRTLVEFAINTCRLNDCYKLSLSTNINRIRAHNFYEKLGFEKHGYSYLINL